MLTFLLTVTTVCPKVFYWSNPNPHINPHLKITLASIMWHIFKWNWTCGQSLITRQRFKCNPTHLKGLLRCVCGWVYTAWYGPVKRHGVASTPTSLTLVVKWGGGQGRNKNLDLNHILWICKHIFAKWNPSTHLLWYHTVRYYNPQISTVQFYMMGRVT